MVRKHHYSQSEAAKRVGATQAAISQYFDSKRGRRWSKRPGLLAAIKPFAVSTANQIAGGEVSMIDTIELFCMTCQGLKRGAVCSIHRHDASLPETCALCKPARFTTQYRAIISKANSNDKTLKAVRDELHRKPKQKDG